MPAAVKFQTPWMGGGPSQAAKNVTVRNAGDTANATTYTTTGGTVTGSNPVATDSNGLLTTYLAPGRYVLKDSAGDRLEITVQTPGTDTPAPTPTAAEDITYDNGDSDLAATDVQAAIDEVAGSVGDVLAATSVTGARDDGTALASLLTALDAAGIIVDNSTAT